ncbi:hypothetical protein VP1G_04386 [Cytospora mali]|uniref:Uncharacterized protein n=1 Tax=Cytospora mali TaxID=578113 RepID=A0A194UZD7_CYTMA|nr:hypothetical protein VP1G_04386 [Valsa mali var. pyri (nom. inval.)]
MSPHRLLTPEPSPEPELPQCRGTWQATTQKRKRSWSAAGSQESSQSGTIQARWENEWRSACQKSLHPFQDGRYEDFEPIFNDLLDGNIDDPNSPDYTLVFFPKAQELAIKADDALQRGDRILASEFYLRACALLRIARYPSTQENPCPVKQRARELQKSLYLKAGRFWENPLDEVIIPHIHDTKTNPHQHIYESGVKHRGERTAKVHRPHIPAGVRLPTDTLCTGRTCPAVLIVSDDRTAHTRQCEEALSRGWGCIVVEVPGAGDCPVSEAEGEEAADALWSSVLDWMAAIRVFDMSMVVAWGLGEAVVRMAGTHGDRLKGCVARLESAGGKDLSMLEELSCKLLLITDGDSTVESSRPWTPVVEGEGPDEGELALFEYGVPGTSVVQHPMADTRTVYKWVEAIVG